MPKSIVKIFQRPLDALDGLLDGLTSYKLVFYFLIALLSWAAAVSFRGSVPFSWHAIAASATLLVIVCRLSGEFFSRALNIARNAESDYITALILALIMSPATDSKGFAVLAGAGFAAIASKYLITISRRHIFNPAAAGAFIAGMAFGHYASWWVGTAALTPLVLAGGLLIMRKMKRFLMVGLFMSLYLLILVIHTSGAPVMHTIWLSLSGTGVLFFAYVMLTEPLSSPDRLGNYLLYVLLISLLYGINRLHVSPEASLLVGNLLAYALERGKRLELSLVRAQPEAAGIYSFIFSHQGPFDFRPGQYMEWTLPLRHSDSRGNRRYLTLSSSPTENLLAFTIRLPGKASHFKQALAGFKPGDKILASHLGGSFALPAGSQQKLAFIAGGIGVTPFRSMVKYLVDSRQTRDISLLYCANGAAEFAFQDVFAQAKNVGVATHYIDTSATQINAGIIDRAVPDYKERLFYISGPYGFVKAARQALLGMDVGLSQIKSDYFPGYG